jgi:hypothetical protein
MFCFGVLFHNITPSEENKNNKASEEHRKPSEALYQHLLEIPFHSYLQKYVGMIGFSVIFDKSIINLIEKVNKNYEDRRHPIPPMILHTFSASYVNLSC